MAAKLTPAVRQASTASENGPTPSAGRPGDEAIAGAITHFGLKVDHLSAGVDSYSSTVRVLTLHSGQRVVLKIPYVQRKLFREVAALEALKSDLPVPELLDVWIPEDEGRGAMLLSLLPGDVAGEELSPALAYEMGGLIAEMHSHALHSFGEVYATDGGKLLGPAAEQDWWELMMRRFELWRAQCEGVIRADLLAATAARCEQLAKALPDPDGPVWTHNDYRPGNILVQDEEITGLIDFESARGGSADRDFVKISHDLWERAPETKRPFLDGYAAVRPIPPIERTLPFYQLHNALGGVAWCIRRTDTADPFFHENMAVLLRLTA